MINELKAQKYSQAYRAKLVTVGRAMFKQAIRRKLITENPFAERKADSQVNSARNQFIPAEDVRKLIDVLPDTEWRLMGALARWGGLRVPSEPAGLTWAHILWDQEKIVLPVPKLEHLPGRETRIIPMFPEIKPFLEEAFEQAQEGEIYLTPKLRSRSENNRTQLKKYIERAGLTPWPRAWQNLRASRATELADQFPSHVASAWLGHTNEIADKHYRSVTDDHFKKATSSGANSGARKDELGQKMVQTESEDGSTKLTQTIVTCELSQILSNGDNYCTQVQVGATGFEPVTPTV